MKMVLNMLSTADDGRLGHVYENLMIDVKAFASKRFGMRIVRILEEASGKSMSASNTRCVRGGNIASRHGLLMNWEARAQRSEREAAETKGDCVKRARVEGTSEDRRDSAR